MDMKMTPCDLIFNYIEKPANYSHCRSINTFENRWRVNVYAKCTIHDIDTIRMANSYAVNMKDNKLEFVLPKL
jgi:hypothetical protein